MKAPRDPKLLAKMAVNKVSTRYQQALQNVAEDTDLEDIDPDLLVDALYDYSDTALEMIARETANQVLRAGRADGLDEVTQGMDDVVWRRSAVLDQNTCASCEDLDGTEIDGPDDDLSEDCEGGELCRCISFAELP